MYKYAGRAHKIDQNLALTHTRQGSGKCCSALLLHKYYTTALLTVYIILYKHTSTHTHIHTDIEWNMSYYIQ